MWSGDKVVHDGPAVTLPMPPEQGTGLGKPLKFMNRPLRTVIPIVIASIGPTNVEMTAEIADGWQPIHFVPDRFERVWGDALRAGAAKRSAELAPLEIFGDAQLAIGEGADVADAREAARNTIGFYVGGMGANRGTTTTTCSAGTDGMTRPRRFRTCSCPVNGRRRWPPSPTSISTPPT